MCLVGCQAEDGIRYAHERLECRRVLFRSTARDAPLRTMFVARLWRRTCDPTYGPGGVTPVAAKASLNMVLMTCPSLKGPFGARNETKSVRDADMRSSRT